MTCTCKDWKPEVDKINGYITMSVIHGMNQYDGKLFVYCPWCGKELLGDDGK